MAHNQKALERNLRDDLVNWDDLQRKIDSIPPIHGATSVSYSGGLDSTVVAYLAGQKASGRVCLTTLIHNYGSLFNHWAGRHTVDLKRIFGKDRIIHRMWNISGVFNEITLKTIVPDMVRYGHFIWCLGCNLSLMTKVIIHNLLYSVPTHLYCSSVGGQYAVMSMSVTHAEWKKLYAEYGIDFRTPLLNADIAKGEERAIMKKAGIWVGYRFRRGVHGVQPICLPGLQHILDVLVDFHTEYDKDKVREYIHSRWPLMKAIIEDYFSRRGLDLEERIQRIKRQHEEAGLITAPKNTPKAAAGTDKKTDKKKTKMKSDKVKAKTKEEKETKKAQKKKDKEKKKKSAGAKTRSRKKKDTEKKSDRGAGKKTGKKPDRKRRKKKTE